MNESLRTVVEQLEGGDEQNYDLIKQLQNKISDTEKGLDGLRSMQDSTAKSTSIQHSKLQKQVDGLSEEIHHPVNLFKDCKEDTKSCSIDPQKSHDYWRDCATLYLPLNKEVRTSRNQLYIIS